MIRLLVVAALTYLGGVGISFAFGRPDPWSAGLLPLAIVLGSAVSGAWIRRAGRGT